jgi:uncharacterized protein YwqG
MNILDKIFQFFRPDKKVEQSDTDTYVEKFVKGSHFEEYRKRLDKLNLKSMDDLEKIVFPIIRPATKIVIQEPSRPPENSQLLSHFGGQPYFEKGEEWIKSKNGKYMQFIFQIFNTTELKLPKSIKLVQLYYDWDEFPWDTNDDGWYVKVYKELSIDKLITIEKPTDLETSKYCGIEFQEVKSLPDWEGIDLYEPNASNLSCILDEDEPWESYQKTVENLIGEQNYQSQLGGYPKWVQGESTPKNQNGENMKLLFQIDSEDNAGLMWGDVGLIYVFYDEATSKIEFSLQCH